MLIIKVINAKYINGYRIELKFNDGKVKIIDFKQLLQGDIFEPLIQLYCFKRFRLNPFTIEWENGADFSPDFLYKYVEEKKHKKLAKLNDIS